jgi:hypothetical protein
VLICNAPDRIIQRMRDGCARAFDLHRAEPKILNQFKSILRLIAIGGAKRRAKQELCLEKILQDKKAIAPVQLAPA